ncbi:MAG: hypothetical protein K6A23_11825, partial [Butyrivibrio sp.]|nr:hypothetical protein [Butyrivibrio sp.]
SYRHCFGYCYPLILPCYIMNIAMLMAIMRKEKVSWTEIGLVILFGATFYRWCKAELSGSVTILVSLAMLIVKTYPKILTSDFILWKVVDRIAVGIYPICVGVSLWFTFKFDYSIVWMQKLNDMTGGRLYLQSKGFQANGFKLLGDKLFFVGAGIDAYGEVAQGEYNYVDNIYIALLLRYGILFSVIAIILLTVAMYYCYQKKMRIWLWMLSLWALHGLFEDKMHLAYYNSLLLMIGQAVQKVDMSFLRARKILQKERQ